MSNVPEGATHFSEARKDVYFAAYWKEGPNGCWVFALDDRKNPKWIFHECFEIPSRAKPIEMPKTWTGEGLPPVGTVCELRGTLGQQLLSEEFTWTEVEIIAHTDFGGEPVAVGRDKAKATLGWGIVRAFRPIRTPEQIEAEEREKAILSMIEDSGFTADDGLVWPTVEALYNAGYRKVQP
jgi:hypothetical protein